MRATAVDGIVFSKKKILLIRRANAPFKGFWALPGGYVGEGETCEQACEREVKEETGVRAKAIRLVGAYSNPKRDPRGTISIAFICRPLSAKTRSGSDAARAEWFPARKPPKLAFDHEKILADALKFVCRTRLTRKKKKGLFSSGKKIFRGKEKKRRKKPFSSAFGFPALFPA